MQVTKSESNNKKIEFPETNNINENFINVLLVDDVLLTRQATARCLQNLS
jgi:hypothetical protein